MSSISGVGNKVIGVIYTFIVAAGIYFFFVDIEYFLGITGLSLIAYLLEKIGILPIGAHSILIRYFLSVAIFVLVPTLIMLIFK